MSIPEDEITSTNFGFRKVSIADKKSLVNELFSSVANKYDLMNDLMSLGIHRLWKHQLCQQITDLNSNILEVAGGTGDISLKLITKAKSLRTNTRITICDINQEMLQEAKNKAINNNILSGIDYVQADAESLPFADASFDYYIIAFGIRNIPNINKALSEALRVLKSGGKFICLEFAKVSSTYLKPLYDLYSFKIIPKLGKLVANDENAYRYLVESIALFPDPETFKILIGEAGFIKVNYHNLTSGIVAIHTAYKI